MKTLIDITPETYRCDPLVEGCPAIFKLTDITPPEHRCEPIGAGCPAVLKSESGDYVVIGKRVDPEQFPELAGRVGPDEIVLEIPIDLIRAAIKDDLPSS